MRRAGSTRSGSGEPAGGSLSPRSDGSVTSDRRLEDGSMAKIRFYDGEGIRVSYDPGRCIHAAECVRGLPAVFDPERRPWIDAEAAPADEVADVVLRCPTGALRYERSDGAGAEEPAVENRLTVTPDGPLYASGDLLLLDSEHRPLASESRAALCRCGASENKPFCDGRHSEIDFRCDGSLGEARMREPSVEHSPPGERPPGAGRPLHSHRGRREFGAGRIRRAMPVRRLGQQALLRRGSQEQRIRGSGPEGRLRVGSG